MNQTRSSDPRPSRKPTVLIIGPTPPPYMGPSVATKMIVESSELREKFNIIHETKKSGSESDIDIGVGHFNDLRSRHASDNFKDAVFGLIFVAYKRERRQGEFRIPALC